MTYWNEHYIVKHHKLYHRVLFGIAVVTAICLRLLGFTADNGWTIIYVSVVAAFWAMEFIFNRFLFFDSEKLCHTFKYIEILALGVLEAFTPNSLIAMDMLCLLSLLLSIEFCILFTDYDNSSIFVRRIMLMINLIVNVGSALARKNEAEWLCYALLQIVSLVIVFLIVDWLVAQHAQYKVRTNKLIVEKNDVESTNEKLLDYQDKVKIINEQINYQKIDLTRAIKELEQVNSEIKSQTDIMKYMASTFDMLKCIDVITDAIVDVKKSRLCALYIDSNVYMNKEPNLAVKTNYTSLERRLRKSIGRLYGSLSATDECEPCVYTGDELRKFDFIGDVNINSLAVLPLIGDNGKYGVMLVGSDKEDFFNSGLSYYESCIVEFGVAIKSANLYYKTQDMARKDGLTGIYNRLYFKELYADAAKKAIDKRKPISVALFDIDKFKNVNDTYGHLMGDEVIKMVAGVSARFADLHGGFSCRYGGEEFLLVLPDFDEKKMLPVLEAMHETIKTTGVRYSDKEIHVNVCIGFSSYPSICSDVELLVSRADKAMYYGKRNGRGRLVMDSPLLDEVNS